MPAINFPGIDCGVVWNDISPRLGMTYDLFGTGKSVARASYSMYFGQMAPGPARRPAHLDRPGQRALSVGGPERRHVRVRRTSSNTTTVPHQERGVRSDQPDELPLAGHDRSEPEERPHARVRASACSRSSCATSPSRSTTCGASTISSPGPIATTGTANNFQAVHPGADQLRSDRRLQPDHLLPGDLAAAVAVHPHQPAGLGAATTTAWSSR